MGMDGRDSKRNEASSSSKSDDNDSYESITTVSSAPSASYFESFRYNCREIAPYLEYTEVDPKEASKFEELNRKMLKRVSASNIAKHLARLRPGEIDRSDTIRSHGEVSRKMYAGFVKEVKFNIYGQQLYERKEEELTLKEKKMLNKLTTQPPSGPANPADREDLGELDPRGELSSPTRQKTIGHAPIYPAPVGFSTQKTLLSNSLGHEAFFTGYNGDWKNGQLHGEGRYRFGAGEGEEYRGIYHQNEAHGEGISTYRCGATYQGQWKRSLFEGTGKLTLCEDKMSYEGSFDGGRREGKGRMVLPSGWTYEGQYLNGKPHGRGIITSKLTSYRFEGTFDR